MDFEYDKKRRAKGEVNNWNNSIAKWKSMERTDLERNEKQEFDWGGRLLVLKYLVDI